MSTNGLSASLKKFLKYTWTVYHPHRRWLLTRFSLFCSKLCISLVMGSRNDYDTAFSLAFHAKYLAFSCLYLFHSLGAARRICIETGKKNGCANTSDHIIGEKANQKQACYNNRQVVERISQVTVLNWVFWKFNQQKELTSIYIYLSCLYISSVESNKKQCIR